MPAQRGLLAAALLCCIALAAFGWTALLAMKARGELEAARTSLTAARAALLDNRLDAARADIDRAGRRTARAAGFADDPVVRLVGHVPVLGRSAAVFRQVVLAADVVARGLLPGALAAATDLEPARLRTPGGGIDVGRLQAAAPRLRLLAAKAESLDRSTDALPRSLVLGPITRGRDQIARQLSELSTALTNASRAVDLGPALLGADRPRRYFVMVQQTSESRGTGGLPGGFAVLEASGGKLRVTAQGTDQDLRNGAIPRPAGVSVEFVEQYADEGMLELWQNVNLSPDLPVVARLVAARWKAQSGQSVDGVIALDALALADVLRGSAPLPVGGRTVTPDQLPDYLAIGQYVGVPLSQQSARKDRLSLVARAAADRLTGGEAATPSLLRGLVDAVRSGHLHMASDDPALRSGLHATGVDGALPTGLSPTAYPVVYSSSGGKLDYFLDRSISYRAGPCTGTRRRSSITVTLRNAAPASGLPPYLTILVRNGVQAQSYDGLDTLSVYGTRGARLVSATLDGRPIREIPAEPGQPVLVTTKEAGLPVWYATLSLPRGQTRRLSLVVDEPVVAGDPVVPEQPLARPLARSVSVPRCD